MTDEITLISQNGLTEETFDAVSKHFTQNEIAQIIMQISSINIWNRIAIATKMMHE